MKALSVVAEDENEAGSYSLRGKGFLQNRLSAKKLSRSNLPTIISKREEQEKDEQDALLAEGSNFSYGYEAKDRMSFNQDREQMGDLTPDFIQP